MYIADIQKSNFWGQPLNAPWKNMAFVKPLLPGVQSALLRYLTFQIVIENLLKFRINKPNYMNFT
jgi:hypothetical protein